jgi:phosphoribosylformylglycinamidine synthase subunit PurL
MKYPEVNEAVAAKLGLLPEELEKIRAYLGRNPNYTELSLYSVMWSEHCSYKNSILWLKKLPKTGSRVMAAAGEENAGLMDIGDGLAVCFKIESHNHPSAIEPFQGAATGVGGIHRDIFTMGARPIATLNSLRFGDINVAKTKRLVKGVVAGISHYGNAFGVPTVGGELYFDPCYTVNPLVNVMSVGVVKHGATASAAADGPGNPVFIVGAATGKDGIHGATFASEDISDASEEKLPSVQVGDPFTEKLLLEATLEVIASGAVAGIQDMGAAGITCSTSEMSAKSKTGMEIHLDKVPLRQQDMLPFEILLSESQERMLVVAHKDRTADVIRIFDKWGIHCAQIGTVNDTGILKYYMHGELVAEAPADSLVLGGGAPVYERAFTEPAYFQQLQSWNHQHIPEPADLKPVFEMLVQHPNLASKAWVSEQYDSMVGSANMNTNSPSDANLIHIHGTQKALAATTDCNSRYIRSNPKQGCAMAVAEAARNIVCSGAIPLGVTNCLNFGNPYNPEVYWQFKEAILGMKEACEILDTPVTGGNVSFYNQSPDGPVFPSPVIGMVGLLEDVKFATGLPFQQADDEIYLLGHLHEDLACSEYLYSWHQENMSPAPHFDWNEEIQLHSTLAKLTSAQCITSAHDVADGGLWICLLESAYFHNKGFQIQVDIPMRKDAFWLGEAAGRAVVSVAPGQQAQFQQILQASGLPYLHLGKVTNGDIHLQGEALHDIHYWKSLWAGALESRLKA